MSAIPTDPAALAAMARKEALNVSMSYGASSTATLLEALAVAVEPPTDGEAEAMMEEGTDLLQRLSAEVTALRAERDGLKTMQRHVRAEEAAEVANMMANLRERVVTAEADLAAMRDRAETAERELRLRAPSSSSSSLVAKSRKQRELDDDPTF